MTTNRLFQLLFYLMQHPQTSASMLAKEFEVSVRTIYRDIDRLSQMGLPIYTETGRNGGVGLLDSFMLDRLYMTNEEQSELLDGLSSLEAAGFLNTDPLLNKLKSLFKNERDPSIDVDFSRWGADTSTEAAKFQELRQAIQQLQSIEICYVNEKGQDSIRKVDPLKLLFKDHSWYLYGYCHLRKAYRLFRCSRLLKIKVLNDCFERESAFPPYDYQTERFEFVRLKLVADRRITSRLLDIFGSEVVTFNQEKVLVDVELIEGEWIVSFLLSLGTAVIDISPVSLKKQVAKQHQAAYHQLRRKQNENHCS
ncbi:DNA-binding transcriptional regulator [Enterococcus florum]|uniref:DNA-binding transcriptional regulator n=1 Tax=Enterococcus florum TaxID=2480627 RepID=A0A4P5P8P5_9ENTE|nr:YafY family protein [Enterococcus florum]GCF92591.1 DNA-binding transcriptional regulator [Enterococcus florum]